MKFYEQSSIEKNLQKQEENLKKIILHCWNYVPYYKRVFEEVEVVSNGKVILENFDKIPILNKEILKRNFDMLVSNDNDLKKRKKYLNSSGGSTGEPTRFFQDQHYKIQELATKWFFFDFITDYPCKHISLWGSERDIITRKFNLKKLIMNKLEGRLILNSFRMTRANMDKYVKKINRSRPKIIESYVQPIYELASFIKNNNLKIVSPKGIITSAGTLYPEMRDLIREVFRCPVLNRYGSREVGDVACSCNKSNELHVNIINNYIEILDENLKPVKPGTLGQIYITKLTNFTMPLIRYKIGDLAIPSDNQLCECKRGLPLIKFVEGREMSVFRTSDGSIIPAEFFIHFIGVVFNEGIISKFQVIQNSYSKLTIKYV
ncbi:MAG: phenylacetate--CoA ligase family protein, partial [Candidatus Thorarchaeota archaeon]